LTNLEAGLRKLVEDLEGENLDFALVGGLAVSIRAEPRLTRDVDVAVSVREDSEAEAAVLRMRESGYVPDVLTEHDTTNRLASARLSHPDRPEIILDMLFASCGIEPEIVAMAETIEALPGLVVPVARTGHLIAMKLLASDERQRPTDYDDLRSLIAIAAAEEIDLARRAVDLITDRGYHRGRNLGEILSQLA
jgi:hypothetical protein